MMDSQPTFLFVQLGRIGDLILMTPIFNAVKNNYPDSKITVLCGRNNYRFLANYPLVDDVLVHWKKPILFLKLRSYIKKTKFDYWIDPKDHFSKESHYFAKLSKAKHKIGFNDQNNQTFTIPLKSQDEQFHDLVVDRNLQSLESLNLKKVSNRPVLFETEHSKQSIDNFLNQHKITDYIHLNVSASKVARQWPIDKWIEFIQNSKSRIPFILSSDPADVQMAEEICQTENCLRYPTKSFDDVISLAKYAKIIISPDTSIIHIAGAFNIPVIGLYANRDWNLKKFYPLSEKSRVLINQKSDTFITDITVNELKDAFTSLSLEIN